MKKTPIQKLIEELNNMIDDGYTEICIAKNLATELLEEEKQMVVDAHESGWHVGYRGGLGQDAEQYFKETYQQ